MTKNMRTRSMITAAAALALALPLAACGDADDDAQAPPVVADGATETTGATTAPEATTDAATTATAAPAPADVNEIVAVAIALAEDDAGGTAFEVDLEDRGTWEISVAVGQDEIDVQVSEDGTEVLDSRPDGTLDSDERAALDAATVGIADAIATALAEVPGTFDDAELDEDDNRFAWEVSIDRENGDDVDVYVDVTSGEILQIDD